MAKVQKKYDLTTILVVLFIASLLLSCRVIKEAHKEQPDYRYLYEHTHEESEQIKKDRDWERKASLGGGVRKGGSKQ